MLPRSHKNLGPAPLLTTMPSQQWTMGWHTGLDLYLQRRWLAGQHQDPEDEHVAVLVGDAVQALPPDACFLDIRALFVQDAATIDGALVVSAYPNVTHLNLWGNLSRMSNASALNELTRLRLARHP